MATKQTYLDWVQSLDVDDVVQIAEALGLGKARAFTVICLYARVTFIEPNGRIRVRNLAEGRDWVFGADGHGATDPRTGGESPAWLLWEEGREPY